jgi:hypothetical protein
METLPTPPGFLAGPYIDGFLLEGCSPCVDMAGVGLTSQQLPLTFLTLGTLLEGYIPFFCPPLTLNCPEIFLNFFATLDHRCPTPLRKISRVKTEKIVSARPGRAIPARAFRPQCRPVCVRYQPSTINHQSSSSLSTLNSQLSTLNSQLKCTPSPPKPNSSNSAPRA